MIMNRTLLRLAAVSALNNFNTAPFPTIGGTRIFDSKIEPIEDFKEDVVYPMAILYTDYDTNFWMHRSSVGKERILTLTIELVVAQVEGSGVGFSVAYPEVDSEVETTLDIFESQIFHAFSADSEAANCLRYLVTSYKNIISRRGAAVDSGQRLAARQLTIEAEVCRDPLEGIVSEPVQEFLTALQGSDEFNDRLPDVTQTYVKNLLLPDGERRIENMVVSDQAGLALGYERGSQPVLGTPVTWLDPASAPLP